ncbi:hypothetical protein J3458_021449 [Metarhizium acridum]|uniref:Hscarg dehydrogenase, putative n=1 Tax=Metarhizium acridum (strain CQMa 102) TaxID=655827 RepID=E9EII8_METAQ|nr:hscarg dehydrogenase, putative [Metarhizium acridum CQMa 102]EFY84278.1 hscarg dehydrogenase, putative [Metarhizium acridum CQMa 102]KAG8406122.1 hypothetical protein J3458_021449 [Metarhizium acridum]
MSQILAVFGATGQQGSSVIDYVLEDAALSRKYKLRAITRDPDSIKARRLADRNIEVIRGDLHDADSLDRALAGVHVVFLVTVPDFTPDALQNEFRAAKNAADVACSKGARYIIFSTLPSVSDISGGKFNSVAMFDAKARAEAYIRSLPIKSAFYSPGSFMENYITVAAPKRCQDGDGAYIMSMHVSPRTTVPLIDAQGDTGKFIGSILAHPDEHDGRVVYGAERLYSLEEIALAMGKATGQQVIYRQVSAEEYQAAVPFGGDILVQTMGYFEEFGYYGGATGELVASAAQSARGGLTSFEEFLAKHSSRLIVMFPKINQD